MAAITLPTGFSYSSGFHGNMKSKTKIDREEFREYMKAGMIYEEVNEKHPISMSTYNRMLDKYGFPRDTFRVQQRREKGMMEMLKSGSSIEEIAKAYNMSIPTCKKWFADRDISFSKRAVAERNVEGMQKLIDAGMSKKQISEKLGIGLKSTIDLMDKMKMDVLDSAKTKRQITQELKKSTVKGWIDQYGTISNIAKNINLSYHTVLKYVKFFGFPVK